MFYMYAYFLCTENRSQTNSCYWKKKKGKPQYPETLKCSQEDFLLYFIFYFFVKRALGRDMTCHYLEIFSS